MAVDDDPNVALYMGSMAATEALEIRSKAAKESMKMGSFSYAVQQALENADKTKYTNVLKSLAKISKIQA